MAEESNGDDLPGVAPAPRGKGEDFLIVGLGASAGGINALKEFFGRVAPDSGMAYVVILHLSPDHESKLAEVLQSHASIPVVQVTQSTKVEPDHVYVIPPNKSLKMVDGRLDLSEISRVEERRAPIDIFFRTLAESHHARAVCVVLSGTGADGSMGMKRVKENGGVCMVQDPRLAEYGDMPRHSIDTGLVDYVLPAAEIPSQIAAYQNRLSSVNIALSAQPRPAADDKALRDIFTHLRLRTGHDFSNYKRSTVLRRIERRISVNNLSDLTAYASFMREQADESSRLLKDLLISVTNFFRDPAKFEALEATVIPKLFEEKRGDQPVRVWVAGCATGEEAYSIAMLLCEAIKDPDNSPGMQVFATDIDEWAINKGREGYYSLNDAADVSPERLRRFFIKEGDGYRVRRDLRELVLFATHNIIKDPPFSHVDMVTCRNLLIYLNRGAQERIMQVLHFALEPGGYLFLGTSESIEGSTNLFVPVDKENHIYQSRPVAARLPLQFTNVSSPLRIPLYSSESTSSPTRATERLSYLDLHQRLLEKYAPPSVVVNDENDILHLSESAGRFLTLSGGEPTHNLLKLVKPELRLELRTALYQAASKRINVDARGLHVSLDGKDITLNLMIRPVVRGEDGRQGYTLVLFEEVASRQALQEPTSQVMAGEPLARQLEEELLRVKSQLRSTSEQHELQQEELKASNEELQAINEELRSAAEELETSTEELQSVNEELTTVNQELKIKIEELSQANNDFQNLMNSTDIATIFLDRSKRVKLFTPPASNIFSLIPTDTGRTLSDINHKLVYENLLNDIDEVLRSLQPVEHEVKTLDGREYLMRLLPYRTSQDHIDGSVITFFDITKRSHSEAALRRSEERLRLLMESIKDYAIFSMDADGSIDSWTVGAEQAFGYTSQEIIGLHVDIIFTPEDRVAAEPQQELLTARTTGRAADERWYLRKDGSRFYASGIVTPLRDDPTLGYVKVVRDLSDQKQREHELEQAQELLETRVEERTSELAGVNATLQREVSVRIRSEAIQVELMRRLVRAQEDERHRIARDLHDQMGQQLTALRLRLETLKDSYGSNEQTTRQVEEVQEIARQIESDIDFLAWELRPAALDDLGLKDTLDAYVKTWSAHFDIAAQFHSAALDHNRFAPEIETNLYRIAQEALNNVSKHAKASRADVILERRDGYAVLIIEDDGVGFDPKAEPMPGSRLGLIGMIERAALLGGKLEIESVPGQGTTLFARVPSTIPEEGS